MGRSVSNTLVETIVMGTNRKYCDVVVADPYTSIRHCRITRIFGVGAVACRILVEDLGSANGTRINGHQIYGPTELLIGDILKIGKTEREIPPYAFVRPE